MAASKYDINVSANNGNICIGDNITINNYEKGKNSVCDLA